VRGSIFSVAVGLAVGLTTGLCAIAAAHGTVPSPASFTSPPKHVAMTADGGTRQYAPYAFVTADASTQVAWDDGDMDPLALHSFYYFDHAPPLALSVTDILARGTPVPGVGSIWGACSCADDLGVVCPDAGVRDCRNSFTWDTSALPPGAYFIVAATHDPPYDIYTVADGPVRVAHGGAVPPAVIVVQPDGFGTFDRSYTTRWIMTGQAPFHVDVAYASDDAVRANEPFSTITSDVPLEASSDGSYSYVWDTSALPSPRIYHVRVTVKDATGQSVFSDSRAGVTIFHPGDQPDLAGGAKDFSVAAIGKDHGGCSVSDAGRDGYSWLLWVALASSALAIVGLRRAP
jgi:hypothetical protein